MSTEHLPSEQLTLRQRIETAKAVGSNVSLRPEQADILLECVGALNDLLEADDEEEDRAARNRGWAAVVKLEDNV